MPEENQPLPEAPTPDPLAECKRLNSEKDTQLSWLNQTNAQLHRRLEALNNFYQSGEALQRLEQASPFPTPPAQK